MRVTRTAISPSLPLKFEECQNVGRKQYYKEWKWSRKWKWLGIMSNAIGFLQSCTGSISSIFGFGSSLITFIWFIYFSWVDHKLLITQMWIFDFRICLEYPCPYWYLWLTLLYFDTYLEVEKLPNLLAGEGVGVIWTLATRKQVFFQRGGSLVLTLPQVRFSPDCHWHF